MGSGSDDGSWREDAAAALGLVGCGLVVGWPLWAGGWATYLDNPAHVAEVLALARGERWDPQAFLGFPVHQLHSPLAYGAVAGLVAGGLPVGLVYGGALLAGLVAPALAVFRVARLRWPVVPSALLGALVLLHPNALVGFGAVTGGMWTFGLASAAFVLLMERVARPERGPGDVAPIGILLGLVAALHPMLAVSAVILAIVSVVSRLGRPRELARALPWELAATALGALLSSGSWLPSLLSGQGLPRSQQSLSALGVLLRLALPTDVIDLVRRGPSVDGDAAYLDALPMLLLLGLGLAGAARRTTPLVRLATAFAAALLALLLLVTPNARILELGPLTWRLVAVVQLALAVAATGLDPRPLPALPAAVVALGASLLSSIPLARVQASSAELAEVEAVWGWLREHEGEIDGRLYVQSTFATPPLEGGLATSQVLARTAEETGVDQVGAWYGVSPYPTGVWTPGEFGRLFRQPLTDKGVERILQALPRAGCSHLLVSDPEAAARLGERPELQVLHREGRFTVLRFDGPHDRVVSLGDRARAKVARRRPGELVVEVGDGKGPIVLSEAWHPSWVVEGRGSLAATKDGLMALTARPGPSTLTLRYRPPLELGWLGWLGLALAGAISARRSQTSAVSNVSRSV